MNPTGVGSHAGVFMARILLVFSWMVGLGWVGFVSLALRKLPGVPDLLHPRFDAEAGQPGDFRNGPLPNVCAIVPACDEEESIAATLRSLAALEGVAIEIIAVDDRSTDATGLIMDAVAKFVPGACFSKAADGDQPLLRVLHVKELPEGWLGKPHAMALAAQRTTAEWLLFTDGDVQFRPDALERAMRYIQAERVDHLVLFPTMTFKRFGERVMMATFYGISVWGARPWKIADPTSPRDSAGIGAFNLVRREVYIAVGGYESLAMEVLDDVRLGFKIKRAGYRQRVAFGRGLIRIRWADGARGVVRNLTKNVFAAFRYRVWLVLVASCGLAAICLLPLVMLLVAIFPPGGLLAMHHADFVSPSWMVWVPVLFQAAALWMVLRYYRRYTGIHPAYMATFPLGACLVLFTVLRSMLVTLWQGGVRWRGTLYPLNELRKRAGPVH